MADCRDTFWDESGGKDGRLDARGSWDGTSMGRLSRKETEESV